MGVSKPLTRRVEAIVKARAPGTTSLHDLELLLPTVHRESIRKAMRYSFESGRIEEYAESRGRTPAQYGAPRPPRRPASSVWDYARSLEATA